MNKLDYLRKQVKNIRYQTLRNLKCDWQGVDNEVSNIYAEELRKRENGGNVKIVIH